MEKRIMTLLAVLFLLVGGAFAQTKVNGTVVSQDDGEPVIGASIIVVGTNVGTVTNSNGQFSLTVPAGKSTLRITYVGMEPLEVTARPNMRILLTSDHKALDEVIVVAYGTQKKSSFTGSAAVVKSDEIGKVQVTNAVDALKGKAAGVQIFSSTGQPGSTPTIRIRGVNSINADSDPLIVLDGAPFDGSINDINPADVESMTVLKDAASTSLYGARGGNGVILITTKSGKRGGDATITVDAKWGVNSKATPEYDIITSPAKYYEQWYSGLNAYAQNTLNYDALQAWQWSNDHLTTTDEFGLGYNVYTIPDGQTLIGQNGKLNPAATLGRIITVGDQQYLLTPDDWVKETYDTGLRQEYTLSANGATDRSTFYLSANYLNNEGITVASDYERFTGRMKADYQLKPWLKVGGNASYSHWVRNYLGDDGTSGSSGNAFSLANIAPIYPVYIRDANGKTIYDPNSRQIFYDYGDRSSLVGQYRPYLSQANPLSANQLDTREQEGNALNAVGTIEIRLPWNFTFTSINNVYMREYRYTNTTNPFFGQYASSNGIVTKEHVRYWNYNYQQRLNWRGDFGKHGIEAMAAHEYTRNYDYDLWASKQNQFSVFNKELNGAVIMGSANSTLESYNDERWLGRAQYSFDDKYYVHASITHEASSHFSKDNRWGTFWSLGGAWLISKENFMQGLKWLDELKLKASYGENGNDLIGSYRYINTFDIANSNNAVSLVPRALGNADISWEKNAKFNVGFDFSALNGRIWGSLEYYANKTNDMLSWYPLPATSGYTGYYANVGNMINRGIEADIHADVIRTKNFTWNVYANLTSNHNEITELPDARKTWYDEIQGYGYTSGSYFYSEGHSRYTYYTKHYAGVYSKNNLGDGDVKADNAKLGQSMWWRNVYFKKQSHDANGNLLWEIDSYEKDAAGNDVPVYKLDDDGNKIPVQYEVLYDKNWNEIPEDQMESYVGETRRKKVGEEKTTSYSNADDYFCGDMLPDVYGGFGTSFSFKGFDLSLDFQYQLGGKVYDSSYSSLMAGTRGFGMHTDMLDRWTNENPDSNIPRLQYNDTYVNGSSDRFITSASYLSLQNITLGYTLPKSLTMKIGVQKLRLYFVADNVWVWSKRQGLDPRQSITGSNSNQYYSSIRSLSGGLSITL